MGVGFKRGGMVSYVTVSVSAQTGGTASGSGRFMKGRTVTVIAAPGSSYIFSGWYNGNTLVSYQGTNFNRKIASKFEGLFGYLSPEMPPFQALSGILLIV